MNTRQMAQIINSYDIFPEYIDSYTQEMQARESNKKLESKFNLLMQEVSPGYESGIPVYLKPATDKKVAEWLRRFEIPAWLKNHYEGVQGA